MPTEERDISRAEMAREAAETHELVKKNAKEGQGDEKSSRDGKGSIWNSRPGGRMPRKDRVMSRASEMAREASETHVLVKTMPRKDRVMSIAAEMAREASETHALVKECRGRTGWWEEQQRQQGKRLKLTFWWKNAEEWQGDEQSRSAEMAREASETHALVKKDADGGEGHKQNSRDGKGSGLNSRAGEKECQRRTGWWAEQQKQQGKYLKLTR
jgi:hypothetical protein